MHATVLECPEMAKAPKRPEKAAPPKGRPPSARGPRPHAMGIKAYPEWSEWLEGFREACQKAGFVVPDSVSVVDVALVELAKKIKHPLPPPR